MNKIKKYVVINIILFYLKYIFLCNYIETVSGQLMIASEACICFRTCDWLSDAGITKSTN